MVTFLTGLAVISLAMFVLTAAPEAPERPGLCAVLYIACLALGVVICGLAAGNIARAGAQPQIGDTPQTEQQGATCPPSGDHTNPQSTAIHNV